MNDANSCALRLLLVSRALTAHLPGGLEQHVEDLAAGLAEAGVQVHLLSAPIPDPQRRRLAALGVHHHGIPRARPDRYTVRYLLRVGRHIDRLCRSRYFDLVHAQEFATGLWRPGPKSPPLVLTVHGTITSETPLHPDAYSMLGPLERSRAWLRFGRRYIYGPFWRHSLRSARRILVDSRFTQNELARLAPEVRDRVARVPLGVRPTEVEPPDRRAARRELGWRGVHLITVGRLEWQKGHRVALEALARLRDLPWHYTIVGTGSHRNHVKRLIDRLGLRDRVHLAGRVEPRQKERMLAAADLFLWPERTHPAFGLVGLEALLHNTPVVATPRGAIPEILGERGGWLVERPDPEAFYRLLRPLLAEPRRLLAARRDLRHDALQRLSYQTMIQATLAEYERACRPDRLPGA